MVFMSCEKPVNTPLYLNTSTCIYKGEYSSNSSISDSKRYKYGFQLSWLKFVCERKCGRGRTCSIYDLQCAGKSGLSRLVENIYNKLLGEVPNADVILIFVKNAGWWQPEYIFKGIRSPPFYIPDYYGYNALIPRDFKLFRSLVSLISSSSFVSKKSFLKTLTLCNNKFVSHSYFGDVPCTVFINAAKMSLGAPCVVAFLIYKWHKRHLSMYDAVEEFLQSIFGVCLFHNKFGCNLHKILLVMTRFQ
ncbi:hypothetical protein CFP56_001737 [Quercus suber]|uniref:Uncharacterized protein n=1 Tax=Quercus suber TaxID=58331 RepID=A0AAW0IME5_QUESU